MGAGGSLPEAAGLETNHKFSLTAEFNTVCSYNAAPQYARLFSVLLILAHGKP